MPIASGDLVIYGAANIAEADGATQGGAINTAVKYIFDSATLANAPGPDTVEVLSSNAGDTTQTVTVTGRNAGGSIVSDVLSLNGTSVVAGAVTFERILKVVVSAAHAGTITVRKATGDTTIGTLETGVTQLRRPFYNVAADASGGSSRDFYEKVFYKNNHATLALLAAAVSESADPGANITFDLEDAVNDNNSIANRLNTAPTGMLSTFASTSKNVPGTDLAAGAAIGVWLKLTLAAGTAPAKSTYTLNIAGNTA